MEKKEEKNDYDGGEERASELPFSAFALAFLVFCLSGRKKNMLLYRSKARACCRAEKEG